MTRKQKRLVKAIQAMSRDDQIKTIQSFGIEGVSYDVALDSLLDGRPISGNSIAGSANIYLTYSSQTTEIYKKYNGESEYGNDQVRAMVDIRTAFIASEGVSVSVNEGVSEGHSELFSKFIEQNRLDGIRLSDLVRTTEMSGYAITNILKGNDETKLIPYMGLLSSGRGKRYIYPELKNPLNPFEIKGFYQGSKEDKKEFKLDNIVYIRTGGYGDFHDYPTTKIGVVLTEAENYDRAQKDMRELNYRSARITPDFKTQSGNETKAVVESLKEQKWKIGQARIGTADFSYKSPATGAHDNLKTEMIVNLKTMSGVTSVPVHWFGWVDQMSNRATAQELYSMISNGTSMERSSIESSLKELFLIMQQVYIDSGGDLIKEVVDDFEIKLPLIDLGKFESMVKAYSMLFSDGIISEGTYRNIVPGIDPILEKEMIAAESEDAETDFVDKSEISIEQEEGEDE
jgi:hypothetical protein